MRRRTIRSGSLLTALFATAGLAAACNEAPAAGRAERADSAGIEIVRSPAGDRLLAWTFEKVLDLGGDAASGLEFHRVHPTSVGTDAEGRIYVLDAGNYRVTVFDTAGTVLRTFGGQGGGPGEMRFPTDMAVGDDGTAAVFDFGVGGFLRYAPDGSPLPVLNVTGALQRELAVTSDRIVGVFSLPRAESIDSVQFRLLAFGGTDTLVLAGRSEPAPQVVTFECMGLSIPPYLSPGIAWSARAERVVARTTADYVIDVYDAGRRVASWRRAIPTLPATLELAIAEAPSDSFRMSSAAGRCAVSTRDAVGKIGYASLAPLVQDIQIARDGKVWVRRRTAVAGELRIDLFDAGGEYTGTLPHDAPWPAAFRGTDAIVTVERDALDLPHVIVYRINRAASSAAQ